MNSEILARVNERQLVSIMNQTKWRRLVQGIETLAFPPAFQMKLITEAELFPPTFSEHVTYLGDWQHLEIKTYSFSNIEWLKVRPVLYRHVGQLLADEKQSCLVALEQLLEESNIPFRRQGNDVIIQGYFGVDIST